MKHSLLTHGCASELTAWLLERRQQFAARGPLLPLRLHYGSFWFERLLAMQDALPIVPSTADPAFVLGFWRSGTTLLHNLLYAGWRTRTPLSWQCFAPAAVRLQSAPRIDVVRRRPMDEGTVRLLGPQEDEFAILLLGEPSLYRGFLDAGRLDTLVGEVLSAPAGAFARWARFVSAVGTANETTLLKSPNHVFRLDVIARLYAQHREVWIGRSFADVVRSNWIMWTTMTQLHGVTRFAPDLIEAFIGRIVREYAAVLQRLLERPRGSLLWLDYAHLLAAPDAASRHAAGYLSLTLRTPDNHEAMSVDTLVHPSSLTRSHHLPSGLSRLVAEIDRLQMAASLRFGGG